MAETISILEFPSPGLPGAGAHPARAGFFTAPEDRYLGMRALASLAIATLEEPFPAFARDLRHALAEIDGRAVAR